MAFCPYAERARLVLLLKNIPHDIVNIDLKNKPEWLFDINAEGEYFTAKVGHWCKPISSNEL